MRRGTSRLAVVLTAAAAALTTAAIAGPPASAADAAQTTASAAGAAQRGTPQHPPAAQFTRGRVDNPWFPLKPGTRYVYRGHEDGDSSRDVVTVTYRTKRIEGVVCRVVRDRLFLDGILRERTLDWYAQTKRGTVWYFGENTAELNRQGEVVRFWAVACSSERDTTYPTNRGSPPPSLAGPPNRKRRSRRCDSVRRWTR